ncbi:MAG: AIR synthase [Chloroflexi bacterium HGW-Chloroflexi-8]|nr:MAG: AIR synthase [Chloroflexi bacterium HGW-Chloroflexi-8]
MTNLPLGKLPLELLSEIIQKSPILDNRVIIGPKIGMDCAIIDNGNSYLVLKNDPITFTPENIGWYAVQINVNDIITTGATPKWMLATILLPENMTTAVMVKTISSQLFWACKDKNISFIGGHTEITHGIDRPIISATLIGEVEKDHLITPCGVQIGDDILLTKGIAIEATAILGNDFESLLLNSLQPEEIINAKNYIYDPGISIYKDATIAIQIGGIHAMHDPTEGGLSSALWEMAFVSDKSFLIFEDNVMCSDLSRKICAHFKIDPINSISSGSLLMTVDPNFSENIINELKNNGIQCSIIGTVISEGSNVEIENFRGRNVLIRPDQDDITKVYKLK